jgi:signal transduction histidine kinase
VDEQSPPNAEPVPAARPGDEAPAPANFRELEHAWRHLDYLYEISKLLTGFEGVERTFSQVMALAARPLALRTALLLEGVDAGGEPTPERPRVTAWRADGVTNEQLLLAAEQAASTYAWFAGVESVVPQGPVAELEGPGARFLAEPPVPTFVTLPLASKGRVFGTLQVEVAGVMAEEGLAFIDAVARQLGATLERHHALRREVRLRERAEALEQAQRGLLERERRARQEAEAAHRRQAFLAEASALLEASVDYRATLPGLVRLLVPAWADCCAIDLLHTQRPGGERLAMMASEPPALPGREPFVARALAAHPWLAFVAGPENLPDESVSVERSEWSGFPCNLRLPIRVRGRTLGVLTLLAARPECYSPADTELFQALAQRISTAVDTALLFQQAQEAVRWREDLLAVVSHDIKTPLLVVRMNAEMLLKAAHPPEVERRRHGRRHVELILRTVDQMRDLIGGILDRARHQGMPMPLAPQPLAVDALFQQALDVLRPLALDKNQELTVDVAPGLPRVRADRERLLQVLSNLVGNAIKFTPPGGCVTVRARKADGQVRISVKDNGPGLRAEDVPHLFERFWRATGVLERGTGLGLSIAKSIVEAHGGSIWVETREGVGSTFFFTLPAVEG